MLRAGANSVRPLASAASELALIVLHHMPHAHYRRSLSSNIKERVRGSGSVGIGHNPLTPTLSPNGERVRTEFAAQLAARTQIAAAIRACLQ
jgi:hypothetical protein